MSAPTQQGVSSAGFGVGSSTGRAAAAAGAGTEITLDFRTPWGLSGAAGLAAALSLFRPVLGLIWILERLVDITESCLPTTTATESGSVDGPPRFTAHWFSSGMLPPLYGSSDGSRGPISDGRRFFFFFSFFQDVTVFSSSLLLSACPRHEQTLRCRRAGASRFKISGHGLLVPRMRPLQTPR